MLLSHRNLWSWVVLYLCTCEVWDLTHSTFKGDALFSCLFSVMFQYFYTGKACLWQVSQEIIIDYILSLVLHLTDYILFTLDLLKCISKKGVTLIKFVIIIKLSSVLSFVWTYTVLRFCARIYFMQWFFDCLVLHIENVPHWLHTDLVIIGITIQ